LSDFNNDPDIKAFNIKGGFQKNKKFFAGQSFCAPKNQIEFSNDSSILDHPMLKYDLSNKLSPNDTNSRDNVSIGDDVVYSNDGII
jgi:hypothetical protein